MNRLAAIVLAAGYSSRMSQFKPLLTIGGQTLTDRTINLFRQYAVEVVLVTSWQPEKLLEGIQNRSVRTVANPDYDSGMFSSVQAGLRAIGSEYQGFFLLPVDIPLVRPFTIRRLIEKFQDQPQKILCPTFLNQRGHPPLIPSSLIPQILDWPEGGGLKAVLQKQATKTELVEVPDENILQDLDTAEDYQAALERYQTYDIPTLNEQTAILDFCCVNPDRRDHCAKVAAVAVSLGEALRQSGHQIDLKLVQAAAALHDIVKDQPHHDATGGRLLAEMGFRAVGDIVGVHTFLDQSVPGYELESQVVYLADKLVQGDRVVSLETRFQASRHKFAVTAELIERIHLRQQKADAVKQHLEELLQQPLETIISQHRLS